MNWQKVIDKLKEEGKEYRRIADSSVVYNEVRTNRLLANYDMCYSIAAALKAGLENDK